MKPFSYTVLFVCLFKAAITCAQLAPYPVAVLTLSLTSTGGTNGSAVAYNPGKNLYYAAIAGNTGFPLETFDETGNSVYLTETGFDVRGLWWDGYNNQLRSNGYNHFGVAKYKHDAKGWAKEAVPISRTSGQPNDQAVGAFDSENNQLIYYDDGILYKVNTTSFAVEEQLTLQLPVSTDSINYTTVIYTGVAGMEAGVLDYSAKKVYLFDISTGAHTFTMHLPSTAITHSAFRFSFSNGLIWLYDVKTRMWTGYKGYLS